MYANLGLHRPAGTTGVVPAPAAAYLPGYLPTCLQGGAVDTVSQGETVVSVPGMLGSRHVTGERAADKDGGAL